MYIVCVAVYIACVCVAVKQWVLVDIDTGHVLCVWAVWQCGSVCSVCGCAVCVCVGSVRSVFIVCVCVGSLYSVWACVGV